MLSKLASWLGYGAAVVIVGLGVTFLCLHSGSPEGTSTHPTADSSRPPHPKAIPRSAPASPWSISPTISPPVTPVSAPQLAKRARPVIRLYVSFPSKAGTSALLEQLRPLVAPRVVEDLRKQWTSGSQPIHSYMEVLKVGSAGQYRQTPNRVEVDAVVDTLQKSTRKRSPDLYIRRGVAVTFEKRGPRWVVTDIADKQGDV